MSRIAEKFQALGFLVSEADGLAAKSKLLWSLALGESLRFCGRAGPQIVINFQRFKLRFQVGQGELTPYREIIDALATVLPANRAELSTWTIIDGGANIGLFSLFCKTAACIIAIEPNAAVFQRLRENFRLNGVRGEAVQAALSSSERTLRIMVLNGSSVLSTISETGNCEVLATTIDALVERFGLERIDLLKLDLEGHEPDALQGARRSLDRGLIRRIYVEFMGGERLAELDGLLQSSGFARRQTFSYNALYELESRETSAGIAASA